MIIVSDASPLINLARIGTLGLLRQLYGKISIPQAVWYEIVVEGAGRPGADEVERADWIETHVVCNESLVQALREDLDAGEAEAIALGLEIQAGLLLMDEHRGRESARHLGLSPVGLIGILIEAKRRGLLPGVRDSLKRLRNEAGFRLNETLFQRVLQDQGEA